MAKGQKKSNREAKKPKASKKVLAAPSTTSVSQIKSPAKGGGK